MRLLQLFSHQDSAGQTRCHRSNKVIELTNNVSSASYQRIRHQHKSTLRRQRLLHHRQHNQHNQRDQRSQLNPVNRHNRLNRLNPLEVSDHPPLRPPNVVRTNGNVDDLIAQGLQHRHRPLSQGKPQHRVRLNRRSP